MNQILFYTKCILRKLIFPLPSSFVYNTTNPKSMIGETNYINYWFVFKYILLSPSPYSSTIFFFLYFCKGTECNGSTFGLFLLIDWVGDVPTVHDLPLQAIISFNWSCRNDRSSGLSWSFLFMSSNGSEIKKAQNVLI